MPQSKDKAAIFIFRSTKKHKLGRGRENLAFCNISMNYVKRFQRRSRKYLNQSDAGRPSWFSGQPPKIHGFGRGRWDLAWFHLYGLCRSLRNGKGVTNSKVDHAKRDIQSQGPKLTTKFDPMTRNEKGFFSHHQQLKLTLTTQHVTKNQ